MALLIQCEPSLIYKIYVVWSVNEEILTNLFCINCFLETEVIITMAAEKCYMMACNIVGERFIYHSKYK